MKREVRKVNAIAYARLIEAMLDGTLTCAELAEHSGLHYVTTLHHCRELHRAGAAHICQWDADSRGRYLMKVFKIGRGVDARRPRMTNAQRQRRTRANVAARAATMQVLRALKGQETA